jgi:DNA-binding transcriptional MerR regulator
MREAMQMQNFDTHESFKVFEGVGFKKQQAEAIVEVIKKSREQDFSRLATKEQLKNVEQGLRQKIDAVEQGLVQKIEAVEQMLEQKIESAVSSSELRIIKWMVALFLPIMGMLVTIMLKVII